MQIGFVAIAALLVSPAINGSALQHSDTSQSLLNAALRGNLQTVEQLVAQGADIEHADCLRRTALTYACHNGHLEVAQFLLQRNANVNHGDFSGYTALTHSVSGGYDTVVQLLIANGADVNHSDFHEKMTPIMHASQIGHVSIAQSLIESGASVNAVDVHGYSALHRAALGNHVTIARLLIENGVDFNHVDNNGNTALIFAAFDGDGRVEFVQLLMEHHANVNHVAIHGETALNSAVSNGYVEVAELLIEHGAELNQASRPGRTSLFFAMKDDLTMCRLLMLAGADMKLVAPEDQPSCVDSLISPLTVIRNFDMRHQNFRDIHANIPLDNGISPIEAFISFAFESSKNGVDVFRHPDIIAFLHVQKWSQRKVDDVEYIINKLAQLHVSGLDVLYTVGPFVSSADDENLRRLLLSLDTLAAVSPDGGILNAIIHRSAHLGFLPALRAIYSIHLRAVEVQGAFKHLGVPAEVSMHMFSFDFEHEAMVELSSAIRRHRAASERIHLGQETPFISTTTEIFPEEKGEVTTLSTEEAQAI